MLVSVSPDTNALNVKDRWATFRFDETINDRGSGAQEIANFFLVSPSDGANRVEWHRSRIDVRPRDGFRPNTAYTVTLLPGLSDLRGNVMKTGRSVTFSTGGTIPTLRIAGQVFDWMGERPAARALVQAVAADSMIYLAQSDSTGRFSVGPLPQGSYLVRAIIDANGNRALDRNEMYDSARVTTPQAKPIELLAIARDTLPPRMITVSQFDSLTLRISFDRPIRTEDVPAPRAFRLVGPDSVAIPIVAVFTPKQEQDRAKTLLQAAADSVRRADSLAGRKPAPAVAATVPVTRPGARPALATLDTPSVRPPVTQISLTLPHPLPPSTTFRLSVANVKALSGKVGSSERSFSTPKPAPPPKTPTPVTKPLAPAPPKPAAPIKPDSLPAKKP